MSTKEPKEALNLEMQETDDLQKVKVLKFQNIVAGGIKRTIEKSIKGNEEPINDVELEKNQKGYLHELDKSKYFQKILKELDITATNENGQKVNMFLGDLAFDGSRPSYIWSENRVDNIRSRISLYTALALMTDEDEACFAVMTGLPLLHLGTLSDDYERNLPGTMDITFNAGPWAGKTKRITIIIAKPTAQAFGIYMNEILDLNGILIRPELAKGHVGVLDTGFRTTNFLYIRDGEPKDLGSDQSEDGMNIVHDRIKTFIEQQEGVITLEEVEKYYRTNKYEISNGDIIDFEFQKTIALDDLLNSITQTASRLWTVDNMKKIIVGGGGGNEYYNLLSYKQKSLASDNQYANAIGYLKGIIRQLNKTNQFKDKNVIPVGVDSGFGYMKIAILK